MKKYLAYYENEWPADIEELTAVKNKPFVGYLDMGVEGQTLVFTKLMPNPIPETWKIYYTSKDGNVVTPDNIGAFGANIVSNTYKNGQGVIIFDGEVTTFNSYAFTKKCKLDTIVIPTSVTEIGSYAFWDCPVNMVVLHDKLKRLGSKCFYNCHGLKSITLPKSIISITNAFMNCKNLQSIIFEGTMEEWNAVYKQDGWHSLVPATYVQCTDGQVAL